MRHLFTFFLIISLVTITSAPASAHEKQAEAFITAIGKNVLDIASNTSLNDAQKEQALKGMFRKNIDFDWIGNFVLGKHRRSASEEQLARYNNAYENFIIKSYGSRFKDYAGETFNIISSNDEGSNKYVVKTEIVRPAEANVLVDYKVKKAKSGFRVYDIIVEGVSLITTQRSEFNSVITRKNLDTLITALEKKAGA